MLAPLLSGPVVRVAPNLLAFNDPELLPKVYHRYVDKTDFYSTGILGEPAPPFQTQAHVEHAVKRKRIASSVSIKGTRTCTCESFDRTVFNVQSEKA